MLLQLPGRRPGGLQEPLRLQQGLTSGTSQRQRGLCGLLKSPLFFGGVLGCIALAAYLLGFRANCAFEAFGRTFASEVPLELQLPKE